MWKIYVPAIFGKSIKSLTLKSTVRCWSSTSHTRHLTTLFYYSNTALRNKSFDNQQQTQYFDGSFQFTPNCNLVVSRLNDPGWNISTPADTAQSKEHAKVLDIKICHPISSDIPESESNKSIGITKVPFKVSPRKPRRTNNLSLLQRRISGEKISLKKLLKPYWSLTKPNLTFLIMLSSTCSYVLAPGPTNIVAFTWLTFGTLLASGAANAINMGREPSFDRQMVRTASRPVVQGLISPNEAYTFAAITGTIGCGFLYYGVNPMVAGLALLNIILYSGIYTSLKRKSILNTWVGAIVGAIPPLMGWAACSSLSDPGAWCLATFLYAWQFPHFNSLSHNIKAEYKRAGYVMTAFVNPMLNARVAFRYSLLMFPICFSFIYFGVCDKYFAFDSSILNGYLTYGSFMFWWQQHKNYSKGVLASGGPTKEAIAKANIYARKTFWGSIWQLPVVLALMMLHKKGQWDRFFSSDDTVERR